MPTKKRIEQFIQAVETQPHDLVIDQFYADEASIQENQTEPRVGKVNLMDREKKMLAIANKVTSKCIQPFLVDGDRSVIKWKFRFEWKNNTVSEIEEITYQTWEKDKIKQEQFFYDPKQFIPKSEKDNQFLA